MKVAALVAWATTAGGGLFLLSTWAARGGFDQQSDGRSRLTPGFLFGHAGTAATGLALWIVFLVTDRAAAAWAAFALLLVVGSLGAAMFVKWLGGRGAVSATAPAGERPAEQHFPIVVVAAHGILALTTVTLVLLAAVGVGD